MFNSEVLEVGIGMAFVFLLMSLICTGAKEWIEGIFKWRAMDLERALRTIFDDESGQLSAHLFSHPLISSLFQGSYDPAKLKSSTSTGWMTGGANAQHVALFSRRNLPSYIPAAQFATALIDLVGRGPANVDGESTPHVPMTIGLLRERAAALSSPVLRRAFLSALDHSEGDLKQLRTNLQLWFDGSMDRASGWYKRRTQAVLFTLGLVAACALNVDALYVMGRLTADKTFREALVNAAAKAEPPASAASGTSSRLPMETAREARAELERIGMPMGWHGKWAPAQMCVESAYRPQSDGTPKSQSEHCTATGYSVVRLAAGWLITALAVMLGAPFWFDVLNKFMVIRSTVKPREKSQEEGSEDRPQDKGKDGTITVVPSAPAPPTSHREAPQAEASPAPTFVPHQWRGGAANPQEVSL